MSTYETCPICEGKGVKDRAFYPDLPSGSKWVECRSCEGRGVLPSVAQRPSAPVIPYIPSVPWQPVYPWQRYPTITPWITSTATTSTPPETHVTVYADGGVTAEDVGAQVMGALAGELRVHRAAYSAPDGAYISPSEAD